MSRKLLALGIASLLLLVLATYVNYRHLRAATPVDPYALVPDDAVLVLSTRNHATLVRHLQETQLWDNLTAVQYFQHAAGHLALADSLAGGNRRTGLLALLGRKLVVTSVHVTGPASFDVLYQIPLEQVSEYRQTRSLLETLGRDPRYRLSVRLYEGHELTTLTERRSEDALHVVNYRNHLLISTNVGLVEAALRRTQRPDAPTVRAAFSGTNMLQLPDVDASVYLNYRRLPQLLDVLFQPGTHRAVDQLAGLAAEGLLGIKLVGGRVELVGFSNPETARGSLQTRLQGQPAEALALASILSNRTGLLLHLAATPARTWPVPTPDPAWAADIFNQEVALDSLQATLGPEMALAYLAAPAPGAPAPALAYARSRAPARTARWLARLRRLHGTSPAFTRVGTAEIFAVDFPAAALLGPVLAPAADPAAPQAAALVGSYLVLGEARALAAALADVAAGQTWGHDPAQMAFLAETLPRTRAGVFVDTRQAWNALLGVLTEDRRAGLLRNETLVRRLPQLAWQLRPTPPETAPDAQYYTQLVLRRPGAALATTAEGLAAAGRGLAFARPLRGTPLAVAIAGTRLPAALVQDSAGVLRYVSAENAVLWADTLAGTAVGLAPRPGGSGPAFVLGAGPRLHWLRPDGHEAPNFPLALPDTARLTDLTATASGPGGAWLLATSGGGRRLRLLDATGRQYPGWQPKTLDFPLAGRAALLAIDGRVVVVAPLQNGYVYAFDQQGSLLPGFPLSAGARLEGGLWAEAGATLGRTRLALVNQHGELLRFTLGGDVLSRRRVATWSRSARFQLVSDPAGRRFVLTRLDGNRLDVYAPNQTAPLLTQTFVSSGPKPVQFFDFDPAHQVLALTEPGPGQVQLFAGQGHALTGPLPSTGAGAGLTYDPATHRYHLLRVVGNELRRLDVAE